MDVKNFYLNMPFYQYKYMRIKLDIIPDKVIKACGLWDLDTDGWVYIEIQKGMYRLPQAGLLVNKCLSKHLDKKVYYPFQNTPELWWHV